MTKNVQLAGVLWSALALSGCDDKPQHYFVVCDQKDGQGWELIDFVKQDGYLTSCTYQSPDRQNSYTTRCDSSGCGIK